MKRLCTIFSLVICTLSVYAQNNVFVLVDVSGSSNDAIKLEAKSQVSGLLSGNYTSNGWTPQKISDNTISNIVNSVSKNGLVEQNSWFCLMPFGNKDTYKKYKIIQNKSNPSDYQTLFNSYPTAFKDALTFSQIAEAFTVSLAKTYGINEYYLIVITDDLDDKGNTKSISNYDAFEKDLLMGYGNESSSIVKNIGTLTKSDYYVKLKKITNVNSSKIQPAPGVNPPPILNNTEPGLAIKIISPPEAKKGAEHNLKSELLNVNWSCNNCPSGVKYTVTVSQYEGGKFREIKKDLTASGTTFNVPDGKFRITVSASNFPAASSAFTCVSVSTGSYGLIIFLLILVVGGAVGYYLWNKKRQEKIDGFAPNKADDIFSKGNGGTSSTGSSNSEYF